MPRLREKPKIPLAKQRDWDSSVRMIRRGFVTPALRNEPTHLVWPLQDFEVWQKAHGRGANVIDGSPNAGVRWIKFQSPRVCDNKWLYGPLKDLVK